MILTPINYYLCLPRTFLKRIYGVWVVAVLLLSAILSIISDTCSKMKTLVFGWWKSMKYDHFRRVAVLKLIFIYDAMLNNLQKIAGLLVLYSFTSIVTKMSDKIKNWRRGMESVVIYWKNSPINPPTWGIVAKNHQIDWQKPQFLQLWGGQHT